MSTSPKTVSADLGRAREDAVKAKGLEALLLDARTCEDDAKLLDNLLGVQQLQGKLVEAARVTAGGVVTRWGAAADVARIVARGGIRAVVTRFVTGPGLGRWRGPAELVVARRVVAGGSAGSGAMRPGRAVEIAAVVTSLVVRADLAWVVRGGHGGSASAAIARTTRGRSAPRGLRWTSEDTRITLAVLLTACLAVLL